MPRRAGNGRDWRARTMALGRQVPHGTTSSTVGAGTLVARSPEEGAELSEDLTRPPVQESCDNSRVGPDGFGDQSGRHDQLPAASGAARAENVRGAHGFALQAGNLRWQILSRKKLRVHGRNLLHPLPSFRD